MLRQTNPKQVIFGVVYAATLILNMLTSVQSIAAPADPVLTHPEWQKLTKAERTKMVHRYETLKQLPPNEQHQLTTRFQNFKRLPPDQQQHMREVWQKMSLDQRRQLQTAMKNSTPEQRKAIREKLLNH